MNEENNDKEQEKKTEEQKKLEKEKRRREIEEILSEANTKTGEQLVLDELGVVKSQDELKKFALGSISDDPEEKYNVYYKGIEKLLKKFLPEGEKYKSAREVIREEKKIFLTRGKKLNEKGIRGADSRMAYIQDMEEIMNLITKWAFESRNYFELYSLLRDKNEELGYHND
ncbi:hypothetical protein N6H18_09575 [Reichenbachiella agarivorans]|uniref:CRISPR type III A-associated protein Csm2 n=1 Tax=Reichenbachiella agarivorans TaxID=2979464 RepID=A0ABY6CJA3_9BACT|nr:hypothetical protein [Reichenbachiella agarivorans]UXP30603.1 hypothetical protein N6H18_09575 [Reichenbachiella agarivorans]